MSESQLSTTWKHVEGPSAGLVQRHLVAARQEALYRRNKDLEQRVAKALAEHPKLQGQKLKGDRWLPVYEKISASLQSADLTINFPAESWFATENRFETYAQQYERSGRNDASPDRSWQFQGDTLLNPARTRANQDDKITFGGLSSSGPTTPRRGLMPGRQGLDRIRERMEFRAGGTQRTAPNPKKPNNDFTFVDSTNRHFDPKTKQVFAALNYGRRAHGSNYDYGTSHFILSPKFKVNALYYPGDTFYHTDASQQLAFHIIGAAVAFAQPHLLDAIVSSCYFDTRLEDTKDPLYLLEAHLFTELRFSGNIETIVLDAPFGSTYHANARKFAHKHGARLVLTDAPA